jgi:hypothetical protein
LGEEAWELRLLANRLSRHHPKLTPQISGMLAKFDAGIAGAEPHAAERAAEAFARSFRALWLDAAGSEASSVYRSPTASETQRIARHHDAFGYERDLQPETGGGAISFPPASRLAPGASCFQRPGVTTALLVPGRHIASNGPTLRASQDVFRNARADPLFLLLKRPSPDHDLVMERRSVATGNFTRSILASVVRLALCRDFRHHADGSEGRRRNISRRWALAASRS